MSEPVPVVSGTRPGGPKPTLRRRLGWLLLLSLLLHTLLTPLAGWLGVFSLWFDQEEQAPPPLEELDAIPIDLFEDPADTKPADALPEDDPVGLIEELVPDALPVAPEQPKPKPVAKKPDQPKTDETEQVSDAGAPEASATEAAPTPPVDTAPAVAGEPSASATAKETPVDAGVPPVAEAPKQIANPVALSGEAGELVKSNAKLGLTLYTDRIRNHPVGKRIAELLPNLPQWNDFFAGTKLNPIRDFDRFFVAGPSFYHTQEVVVALQYNTKAEPIRAAIDQLVKRRGRWLESTPIPMALAEADRAERLFLMPAGRLVLVVPPRLQKQAVKMKVGIPDPIGPEALVASMREPRAALARLGLQIPETTRDALLRITPLENGQILIELTAQEESPEAAKRTAQTVAQAVNSFVELVSSASSLLSQFGFGGLKGGVTFPKITLEAHGKEIRGRQILSQAHADFILDRVERQLALRSKAPAPRVAPPPKTKNAPSNKP